MPIGNFFLTFPALLSQVRNGAKTSYYAFTLSCSPRAVKPFAVSPFGRIIWSEQISLTHAEVSSTNGLIVVCRHGSLLPLFHHTGCPAYIIALCLSSYFITYLVPLPLPSIFTTPFFPISFSNCVVFDLPNGA